MAIDLPAWQKPFPDQGTLKTEVTGMVEAIRDAVLTAMPEEMFRGIYFKGSAQKEWQSPIDYVPELSDADIHLWYKDDVPAPDRLSLKLAADIRRDIIDRFFARHPHSLHVPRPQIVVLNDLIQKEGYVLVPSTAVDVLYGEPYPVSKYEDGHRLRALACQLLLDEEEFLAEIPYKIVDRPGHYLWEALRSIAWHLSPVGPRVLVLAGVPAVDALTMNRTRIVQAMDDLGETEFAETYATYYLAAWQYFFSGHTLSEAANTAVMTGVEVLERGIEFAKRWAERNGEG